MVDEIMMNSERGIVFSTDATITAMVILLMLSMAIGAIGQKAEKVSMRESRQGLAAFAESLSEAIVKNRNPEKPWLGAAKNDDAKARVVSNLIDSSLLAKIGQEDFGKYRLAGLYERSNRGKAEYFMEVHGECIAIERFVIISGAEQRKAVLGVVACA